LRTCMNNYSKVFKIFRKKYQPIPLEAFGKDKYRALVSTILSSRTKDVVTLEASNRLFEKASSLGKLNQLKTGSIQKLIYPVGFYKTKAKHLKKLAEKILTDFQGRIPNKRNQLMVLPGVGRKTANLVLTRSFGIPAIAVDTHVHRISNLLGWVKTKKPEQTEIELLKVLPKKYWPDTNRLFVSIGQRYRNKAKLLKFLKENNLIRK